MSVPVLGHAHRPTRDVTGWRTQARTSLLALSCCLVLAATPVLADTSDGKAVSGTSTISLWVKDAPLSLLVQNLGQLSGREVTTEGSLGVPVSGRFSGTLAQTLAELATNYPVLFDVGDDTLHAIDSSSGSRVSIAILSDELDDDFKKVLFEQVGPGNDIEIRADAIRVAGHPDFVKRTTGMITRTLADNGARHIIEQKAETVVAIEAAVSGIATAPAPADIDVDVDQLASEAVIDAGSDEMLADIATEGKPPAEQAELSKPIRWVTDIPGFHTF